VEIDPVKSESYLGPWFESASSSVVQCDCVAVAGIKEKLSPRSGTGDKDTARNFSVIENWEFPDKPLLAFQKPKLKSDIFRYI
jgi:hypothetical protein